MHRRALCIVCVVSGQSGIEAFILLDGVVEISNRPTEMFVIAQIGSRHDLTLRRMISEEFGFLSTTNCWAQQNCTSHTTRGEKTFVEKRLTVANKKTHLVVVVFQRRIKRLLHGDRIPSTITEGRTRCAPPRWKVEFAEECRIHGASLLAMSSIGAEVVPHTESNSLGDATTAPITEGSGSTACFNHIPRGQEGRESSDLAGIRSIAFSERCVPCTDMSFGAHPCDSSSNEVPLMCGATAGAGTDARGRPLAEPAGHLRAIPGKYLLTL